MGADSLDLSGASEAAAAGVPDPAFLTRLANEMFGSLPRQGEQALASATLDPGAAMPSEAALPGAAALAAPAFGSAQLAPGFSFLQDARSLDALAQLAMNPATGVAAPSAIPSEAQLRTPLAQAPALPGVQAVPVPDPAALAAAGAVPNPSGAIPGTPGLADLGGLEQVWPQILGASSPMAQLGNPAAWGFLDEIRPLTPPGVVPNLSPTSLAMGYPNAADLSSIPFDVHAVRRDFPILNERVNGRPLVWLDNAATTQKPQAVIDRLSYFYEHENSNVHRAAHTLAARSTDAYEAARETVRRFLNASSSREIVFVRGTTEGINLVAQSWGRRNVQKDDEIVLTWLEHHANIVPWQMLCAEKGAKLRIAPVDNDGQVLLDEYERLLNPRTRLVAFSHVSNALGTVTPVNQMIEMAHRHGAKVLLDAAQSVAHMGVDVQAYDCDFLVFSGHKIFAPTGIGVVFGKSELLDTMPPWQGGGNMIADVTFEKTLYNLAPVRFEAGTASIADAVGLGAALDYVQRLGMPNIHRYEQELLEYGTEVLKRIPGLRLIGTAREKASVMSFVLDGYRTEDVGAALAQQGIAVRAGHHCAQPIHRRFGLESSVRPSLAFYNTCEEIDALSAAIWNLKGGRLPRVI